MADAKPQGVSVEAISRSVGVALDAVDATLACFEAAAMASGGIGQRERAVLEARVSALMVRVARLPAREIAS